MSLTHEDVHNLADLARLELTEEELAKAGKDLEAILAFVDQLQRIDTTDVESYTMPARAEGWRPDEAFPVDELTRELILGNFPSRKNDLLHVPAVFKNPKA